MELNSKGEVADFLDAGGRLKQPTTLGPFMRKLCAFASIACWAGENHKINVMPRLVLCPAYRYSVLNFKNILAVTPLKFREPTSGVVTAIMLLFQFLLNLLSGKRAGDSLFSRTSIAISCSEQFSVSFGILLSPQAMLFSMLLIVLLVALPDFLSMSSSVSLTGFFIFMPRLSFSAQPAKRTQAIIVTILLVKIFQCSGEYTFAPRALLVPIRNYRPFSFSQAKTFFAVAYKRPCGAVANMKKFACGGEALLAFWAALMPLWNIVNLRFATAILAGITIPLFLSAINLKKLGSSWKPLTTAIASFLRDVNLRYNGIHSKAQLLAITLQGVSSTAGATSFTPSLYHISSSKTIKGGFYA